MARDSRTRYDEAVRSRAVGLFDRGWGYSPVARELGIPADTVREWLFTYRAVGMEGLLSMGSKQAKYTFEQKCAAARAVVDRGMPIAAAMASYGVASRTPLQNWCKAYREGGEDALRPKPKGRPRNPEAQPRTLSHEQELEARVRKLEAENAYLKKLAALRAEETLRTGSRPRW